MIMIMLMMYCDDDGDALWRWWWCTVMMMMMHCDDDDDALWRWSWCTITMMMILFGILYALPTRNSLNQFVYKPINTWDSLTITEFRIIVQGLVIQSGLPNVCPLFFLICLRRQSSSVEPHWRMSTCQNFDRAQHIQKSFSASAAMFFVTNLNDYYYYLAFWHICWFNIFKKNEKFLVRISHTCIVIKILSFLYLILL